MSKPADGERLFVYGSLLDPAERWRLLRRDVSLLPATLFDFSRARTQHYFVTHAPGASVDGAVLLGLDRTDLRILDEYEQLPELYTRERITVRLEGGSDIECWIYLPTAWARNQG